MLREKLKDYHIVLASGSPRRQQFFKELGIDFEVILKPVKETFPSHLKKAEITNYLAELKATVFTNKLEANTILITSDTIVWHEGMAMGKPKDPAQALEMIKSLSGKTHEVITSVSFRILNETTTVNATTKVRFGKLSDEEIKFYIDQFRPFDKAGGYGIQEWIGLIAIDYIEGSYFNVVGMPTHLVYETLLKITS